VQGLTSLTEGELGPLASVTVTLFWLEPQAAKASVDINVAATVVGLSVMVPLNPEYLGHSYRT